MKNITGALILVLSVSLGACQKQTDEQRRAEVEREVQQRLAAEQQRVAADDQQQQLAQREADVAARERALNSNEGQAADSSSTPEQSNTPAIAVPNEKQPTHSYDLFYTRLEPYGDWLESENYGYVYRPRQTSNENWRPYTNGRWVYTDAGWTWISEEPFGWATYHYGRWTRLHNVGWVWVPGDEWAPAWVSWRKGGEFVGWAPLPPEAQFDRRSGIRNWSDNYYDIGPDQYVFVATPQFGDQRIDRVIVPEQRNVTIVNQTTNVTNITYQNTTVINQGPDFNELRRVSRQPIEQLRLERETVVSTNSPRAVVHGQVVAIPAPVIAPATAGQRGPIVKEKIARTPVERGWGATSNQPGAEQARAKMKGEATPPPNAPPKKFTPPNAAAAAPIATASARALPSAAAVTTPRPLAKPSATVSSSIAAQPTLRATPPVTPRPFQRPSAAASLSPPERRSTPAPRSSLEAPANNNSPQATAIATPVATPFLNQQDREKEEQRAAKETGQQMQAIDARQHREDAARTRNRAAEATSPPSAMAAPRALERASSPPSLGPAGPGHSPDSLRPKPATASHASPDSSAAPGSPPPTRKPGEENANRQNRRGPDQSATPALSPSPSP